MQQRIATTFTIITNQNSAEASAKKIGVFGYFDICKTETHLLKVTIH